MSGIQGVDKLSTRLSSLVPDFVNTESPEFVAFLKAYFEFLEQETVVLKSQSTIDTIGLEDGSVDVIYETATISPSSQTVNKILTEQSPIKLSWTNNQGITFEKEISLDNKFLFNIKQKVINSTNKKYDFYSYGQIIRNEIPEIIDFLILHEGLIATLDDELIEEDYDDIQEKKFSKISEKGWLGISDKYWITSLIPPQEKEFKTTFDYKDKFRANFVSTEPLELNENSLIEETLQIIVAAKRVDVIDGYAESLNIDKFDLTIDWGFLYLSLIHI